MLLLVLLAVAEPSAPPLVPVEQATPVEALVAQAPTDAPPPPPSRGKRLLGTAVGALVGDVVATGAWFAQLALVAGACGLSCLSSAIAPAVTGAGTLFGIAPLGGLIGNSIVGGSVPYWKMLLGTGAGAVVGGIFLALFEAMGLFRGPSGGAGLGAGLTVTGMQLVLGQVIASEIGVDDP